MKNRMPLIFAFALALVIALAACGGEPPAEEPAEGEGTEEEAPAEGEGEMDGEAEDGEMDGEAEDGEMDGEAEDGEMDGEAEDGEADVEGAMPGEGTTVRLTRATWNTGWINAAIYQRLLEELGYEVEAVNPLANDAFYLSVARGDVDMWANGWFPLHNNYLEDEQVQGQVELVGYIVEQGALQGYLIDKATYESEGIDNLGDLQDPAVAEMFDYDGDGQANLIGCPEGWGCAGVINHHIEAYELGDTVQHTQGEYALLMADTIGRYQRGESILFYTWTPNWTVNELVPGEDVVWIEVPEPSLPEDQAAMEEFVTLEGIEGCVNDPCQMGFPYGDIRVVGNSEFLGNNPAVEQLAYEVSIPFADINAQNSRMEENDEKSYEDILTHADDWIEENRENVDEWLAAAVEAAETGEVEPGQPTTTPVAE
jgi:glycine betaine/proline transport system substrate-binding protein